MTDLDYGLYLRLATVLDLQNPRTPPDQQRVHLSEHLFIVVHQTGELWLRQSLLEARAALGSLAAGDICEAVRNLKRAVAGVALIAEQTSVLELMPVEDFRDFRARLGTASGAQSAQFHELFRLVGLTESPGPLMAAVREVAAANGSSPERLRADHDPTHPLHQLADVLEELGHAVWNWQATHVKVVGRFIGDKPGTAGTSGAQWLSDRTRKPFPDLDARAS